MINQYYLKNSIMKGESRVADLERYLREKEKQEATNEVVVFKEKEQNSRDDEERKLPHVVS